MTFAEKLQVLRKSHGWSQEELAAQIPISRQAVSKWESGAAVPDTENVLTLADLFGVSTDYLLRDNCESDADIPAVRKKADKFKQAQSCAAVWIACAGIQFIGLIGIVAGCWVFKLAPYILFGVVVQAAGIIGVEVALHYYVHLPETKDIRRKFYRISVWAFSWFPCNWITSMLFRMKMMPYLHLKMVFLSQVLYLIVSLAATWLLRPRKE